MDGNGSLWKVILGSLGAFVVGMFATMRAIISRGEGRERDRELLEAMRRDIDKLMADQADDRRNIERLITSEQIRSRLEGPSR